MEQYLEGDRCRRAVLDQDMDGDQERKACRTGEQFCDVCQGQGKKRVRVVAEEDVEANAEANSESPSQRRRIVDATPAQDWQAAQRQSQQSTDERVEVERAVAEQEEERQAKQEQEAMQRQEFQRQERERQAIVTQQQQRNVNHANMVEVLTELFDTWGHGCGVCRIRGQPASQVGWRLCPHQDQATIHPEIDEVRKWLTTVRWQQAWAACQTCWDPRAICHMWEAVHDRGPTQHRRRRGGQCQYRGVLCEAVAALIQHAGEDAVSWMEDEAMKAGFDGDQRVNSWLGSVVRHGGVEMSGMCWFFYQHARRDISSGET